MRITALTAFILSIALSLTACSSAGVTGKAKATPTETAVSATPGAPTASVDATGVSVSDAAQALAHATGVEDLGHVRDVSSVLCPGGGGCTQALMTDTVSIYAFPTEAMAKDWCEFMRTVNNDWRAAGPFALSWTSPKSVRVPKSKRAELVRSLEAFLKQRAARQSV
ncbi:hypothetical protein LO771_28880 [Streptacidiphilus sp. ASG 303]|uniref:hypothetical protein n=1 Tax=Streptacidiphilus sp. ASG 303 TaxID=2896847 RepID=UPI001E3C2627|nr:hypothetical protein [Streptacidiphilus sp. ASG 303]MCD0486288.1 hypothetical protein [Streptacidiphilus sp. ASG 303]